MTSSKRQYRSNRLRIIGGTWGGRQLSFPNAGQLRPTPDNVRETLFNWLAPHISQARCLDLYAGSGAIGLEALSRGASHVMFVESDRRHANAIKEHIETLSGTEHATIRTMDAIKTLKQLNPDSPTPDSLGPDQLETEFDLVFMDPPFNHDLVAPTLDALIESRSLRSTGMVYVEHEKALTLELGSRWDVWREKSHGAATSLLLTPRRPVD